MSDKIESIDIIKDENATISLVQTSRVSVLRTDYEETVWQLVTAAVKADIPKDGKLKDGENLLAEYVTLAGNLAKANSEDLYCAARYGLAAFQHGMWGVAAEISKEVRFAASTTAALGQVMTGLVTAIVCVIGLVYTLFILIITIPGKLPIDVPAFVNNNEDVILGTCFGFFGSIVSLLLRLPEFDVMRGRSRQYLFLTGFTLPVIGILFAAVISTLFASRVVSFSLSGEVGGAPAIRLYAIIGFLSGFSERFSRSLLTTLESRLVNSLDRGGKESRISAKIAQSEQLVEQHVIRQQEPMTPNPARPLPQSGDLNGKCGGGEVSSDPKP